MICSGRRSSWTFGSPHTAARFACVLLLSVLPWQSRAQSGSLQVRLADREEFTQQPRDAVATTFNVRNSAGRRIEVESQLALPSGWRALTPDAPFELGEQEAAIRLVSFLIPEGAAAGEYAVMYEVRGRREPAVSAAYTLRVHVLPAYKVEVRPLESPNFAIEGERYRSEFLVRNPGNAPILARFNVRSAQGAEREPRSGTIQLAAGESRNVAIESIAPRVNRQSAEQLTFAVEVVDTQIRGSASSVTQIVPRVSPADAYHTLSSRVSLDVVGRNASGERASGLQPAIVGSGSLDEDGAHRLRFALRGPDARNGSSFGSADEYWVRYEHRNWNVALGDNTYELSPLTEPGRYGFGGKLGYQGHRWGYTAYNMHDRIGTTGLAQTGLDTYLRLSRDTVVDVNLLQREGGDFPATIGSLRTQTRWSHALLTDLEVGQSDGDGERGRAYRGSLAGSIATLRYYAMGWQASPEYRGYLRDKRYLTAGFDVPRRTGWSLHGYYRLQDWNVEEPEDLFPDLPLTQNVQDLMRSSPTERQASLGTDRRFGRHTRLMFDVTMRTRTDLHQGSAIDVTNRAARVGLGRSWKSLSLLYSVERGITQDEVLATQFDTGRQVLSASWQASRSQTYSFYGYRDENTHTNQREPVQTTLGLSASYALGVATSFSLNAQRNETRVRRGALYDLTFRHERPDGGRIALIARRIEGRRAQTDLMLTYSVPLAIPMFRKQDIGSVRGRVYDIESGAGLPNIVMNLDGLTAVTNADGDFEFPVVKASAYRLSMDRANVAVGKVPVDALPLEIDVSPRERQQIPIGLVSTASVSVLVTPRPAGTARVENVLVTLTHGDTILRRLTDSQGRVRLGGLIPGRWTVAVAADTLPEGHSVSALEQRIDVAPGGAAAVEFALTPIVREIKMLPPLQVRAER